MIDKHTRTMAVVHYLNFHRSLRKVAKIYNCCHTTLSRWIKRDHGDKPKIRKISSIKRIDELVSEIITDNPFNRLIDIVHDLKKRDVNISKSSVHRILTKYKFSRKRVIPKYCPKPTSKEDASKFLTDLNSDVEIISIDESSVYLESCPIYGYSKKGTRLCKRMNSPLRGNRVTLILAISNKRGVVHHQVVKGSSNTSIFTDFIKNIENCEKGSKIILDNVRFHHSKSVKDAALHRELNLVYTPPYQPDFNPVENAFSVIKSHTRRFDNSISESITLLTPDKISCFYEHSRNFIRTFIDNCSETKT
jgi:transposase/arginine repressor